MRPQIVTKISILLLHLLVPVLVFAQRQVPPPPERTGGTPPIQLPLDDNLIVLVIAGLVFGLLFFLFKKRKATN
tara:strand:- start:166564 stop:166785 length:222 start_codon:yes stop_codon:yes gene_type:complete